MTSKIAKALIVLLILAFSICALFACSENRDVPPDGVIDNGGDDGKNDNVTPDDKNKLSAKDGYEYGEDIEITYTSEITDLPKHAMVTLPADYDEEKAYPVLYLLHGMACDHKTWLEDCNAKYIVQNLHFDENVKDVIIVSVNCIVTAGEVAPSVTSPSYAAAFDRTADDIVTSLMPYINQNFSTSEGREHTALAGFSMGGREALLTAFKYPEAFGYVGAFSAAGFSSNVMSSNPEVPDFKITDGAQFEYLMLAIGSLDFSTGHVTTQIANVFDKNEVQYVKKTYVGGHDYSVWKNALYDFTKAVFA